MVKLIFVAVLAVATLTGCEIDSGKLDSLECTGDVACGAPDLACVDEYCVARACGEYRDCGGGYQYVCEQGLCRAIACDTANQCSAGFACIDGYCSGETCGEDDGDGFLPIECGGRDCDDDDDAVHPDAPEGGLADDPTCTDGKDNDCDGATDDADAACRCANDSDCDDGNTCTEDVCVDSDCLHSGLGGGACDDQDPCSIDDRCVAGSCAGEQYSCDDGLACTAEECDGAGGCANPVALGFCVIDGICRAQGEAKPNSACEKCDPAAATARWVVDAAAIDDSIACTTDSCEDGISTHRPDDAACGEADVCAPCAGTADGCVAAPSTLELSCDPAGDRADCTIELLGSPGETSCLGCVARVGITELEALDFTGCGSLPARGWMTEGTMRCPIDLGVAPNPQVAGEALEVEDGGFAMSRTFDTTDLDVVRLCFDYADDNAGADDAVRVGLDTDGSFDTVFESLSGPVADADDIWFTQCVELTALDPGAADNPSLGLRIEVSASGVDQNLYLDNIALEGWQAAYVSHSEPLAQDDFTGCGLDAWTVDGQPSCPVEDGPLAGREAVEVRESPVRLDRGIDASTVCDDLTLSFVYATVGAATSDTARVMVDAGQGPIEAWAALGAVGADGTLESLTVRLSRVAPDLRFDSDALLSFMLDPSASSSLILDDVELTGASCAAGAPDVAISAVEGHGNRYELNVSSTVRTRVHVSCDWDGRAELQGRVSVDLWP